MSSVVDETIFAAWRSMSRSVLFAGTVSLALVLSAARRILSVLLIVVIDNRQALLQGLRILSVLKDLVHLQEVCFLAFGYAFNAHGQFLWPALLPLPLPLALPALAASGASFPGAGLFVQKAEEHGVAILKILSTAALRMLVAATVLSATTAAAALSTVLLLKQYAEFV